MLFRWFIGLVALLSLPMVAYGQNQRPLPPVRWEDYDAETCGSLGFGFGPFDYRSASQETRVTVEGAHFTRDVENLKGFYNYARQMRASVGGDIAYTLSAFPNHPRALFALTRLEEKERTVHIKGMQYPVPCWFERALRFQPDDQMVRTVLGVYLMRRGDRGSAIKMLEEASQQAGDSANLHYNLGLAYLDAKEFDRSLDHAKKAYALGFPLPGLKERLQKAGQWRE